MGGEDALPLGWESQQTPDGRTYFANHDEWITTFDRPTLEKEIPRLNAAKDAAIANEDYRKASMIKTKLEAIQQAGGQPPAAPPAAQPAAPPAQPPSQPSQPSAPAAPVAAPAAPPGHTPDITMREKFVARLYDGAGGIIKALQRLKKGEGELDEQDPETGGTLLMMAASHSRGDAVGLLLRLGANPRLANKHGATALHMAALKGEVGIISELLANGADVHAMNEHGQNPLHFAALRGPACWEHRGPPNPPIPPPPPTGRPHWEHRGVPRRRSPPRVDRSPGTDPSEERGGK
jgi:hypothetical protein